MEISKAPEVEKLVEKVELTPQQIKERMAYEKHQHEEMLKERKRRVKVIKEDVEWMEANYKYMQLRMALPELEFKYNQFLQKEEELFNKQQAVKESMDNEESPVKETDSDVGTEVEGDKP